jgi:hypothetical protein
MSSEIKDKYTTPVPLVITIAAVASSATAAGQQGDMIDNTTTRAQRIKVYGQFKLGTSPAAGSIYLYAIRGDKFGTPYRTDGAGATAAALTFLNAQPIGVGRSKASPATGDLVFVEGEIVAPGPEWSVGFSHDTGVPLEATPGNHYLHWIALNPEVQ